MPLTEKAAAMLAAASLMRAGIADDHETGILIIEEHGGRAAGPAGAELTHLLLAVNALAARVLLSANGFNVADTLTLLDQWIEIYGRDAATADRQ
jgi:hypothetical protein